MAGEVKDLSVEEAFGAATLLLVLHFLDDDGAKLDLLRDIAGRLRPGAPFVLLDITGDSTQIRENLQILKHLIPLDADDEQVRTRLERIGTALFPVSEERLAALLVQAGFERPTRFFQTSVYMGWLTTRTARR